MVTASQPLQRPGLHLVCNASTFCRVSGTWGREVALVSESTTTPSQRGMPATGAGPAASSHTRLADVLSITSDAVITLDAERRITFFNGAAEQMFGFGASELMGQPFDILCPERFRVVQMRQVGEFAAAPRTPHRVVERLELAGQRKDGEEFPLDASMTKLEIDGAILLTVVLHDIGSRRRAEEALRRTEEQFRLLVESVSDYAIFMLDTEGHVISWNAGAGLIKGYTAEEIIGRHFSVFYPAEAQERDQPRAGLQRARVKGHVEDEGWRVRKDGSRFWANVVITALREPDGRLVGFAKVTRDLTERQKSEQHARELLREQVARAEAESAADQLAGLTAELEATIAELQLRTAEEANARAEAEAARLLAEDASLARSRFLAIMSHELRTPLNAVLGFTDLLAGEIAGPVTDLQRDHLSRIQASSWHLLALIDQLLNLSRIEAGGEDVRLEPTDFASLGRESIRLIEPAASRKGLRLLSRIPDTPLIAATDAGKVRQVLLNLLGNAVKFTDTGEVELTVEKHETWVRIQVRDTGIGIAHDEQSHVFELFTQVEPPSSRSRGGSGVGLSVTRHIATLLGGDVHIESEPGRGSVFTVRLPADRMATEAAARARHEGASAADTANVRDASAPPTARDSEHT